MGAKPNKKIGARNFKFHKEAPKSLHIEKYRGINTHGNYVQLYFIDIIAPYEFADSKGPIHLH